jgi:hypothetical protein
MRGSRVFALVGALLVAALCAAAPAPARAGDQAPVVTLTEPARLNPGTVSGVAGLAAGDGPSVAIEFYEGADATGSAATVRATRDEVDGTFSALVPRVGDGLWTVRAVQADTAGNTGVSEAWTFTIDHTGPQVALTAPDAVTGDAIPHFEGVIGTAPGDIPAVTLTVTSAGGGATSFDASPMKGGLFSADAPAPLADGTYTVVASQVDDLGHVGRSSRTFVIDTAVVPDEPIVEVPPATIIEAAPRDALRPAPAAAVTPQPVAKPAPAGLRFTSASASRRGKTVTLKLRGTAAKAATGSVRVTVAGVRKTAKLSKGSWAVTVKVTARPKRSLKVTAAYGGDGRFTGATVKRTVRA